MNLKTSQVKFEAGLCTSCPIIVQTFFDKNFTAVLHIIESETQSSFKDEKDFILYKFELGKGGSYESAPKITKIERAADYISKDTQLIKTLTPDHARLLLSSKPDHKWSNETSASLLTFAGLDQIANSVYFVICRVDNTFECEKIRSISNPYHVMQQNFEKIKSNKTHVMISFSNHFLSFPLEDNNATEPYKKMSFNTSVSKVTYYEGRWFGICETNRLCGLKEDLGKLYIDSYFQPLSSNIAYDQLITSGRNLVARYEAQDYAGFHILTKEDKMFFTENNSTKTEDDSKTDLIAIVHRIPKTNMPKRYYEFQGRFMFATETDISMFVVPPTLKPPAGKLLQTQKIAKLNRTNSMAGERIILSLPLQEGENSFALLSEETSSQTHSHHKNFLINEVYLSNAYIDLNEVPNQDLLDAKTLDFEAYYFQNPNFKQIKYSLEFIETIQKPKVSLLWILAGFFFLLLILFVIFCFKFRKAITGGQNDNIRPEDCSLMEPILGTSSPMKIDPEKLIDDSRRSKN